MKETIAIYINDFEFRYTVEFDYHPAIHTDYNHNPSLAKVDCPEQFILKSLVNECGDDMSQMLKDEKICEFIVESIKDGME